MRNLSSQQQNEESLQAEFSIPDDPMDVDMHDKPTQQGNPPNNQPNLAANLEASVESRRMKNESKEYVNESMKNRAWMDVDMQAGVELLDILHQHRIVSIYDKIMDWHVSYIEAKS